MPFFRKKSEKTPKLSSLSLYGQGRSRTPPCNSGRMASQDLHSPEENQQPFLAFAEVTYDPSLPIRSKSRLSKTLDEMLQDNAALAYFIQFMDFKHAKHLVKFWLEAESFRISMLSRLQGLPENDGTNHNALPMHNRSDSSGCVSDHSDDIHHNNHIPNCDSYEAIDESEIVKHDLCSANVPNSLNGANGPSKKCSKASNSLQNENDSNHVIERLNNRCDTQDSEASREADTLSCDCEEPQLGFVRLKTSVEEDATAIYEKYISLGSPCPIGIGDALHQQIRGNIFNSEAKIDQDCFDPAQQFVKKTMDEIYFLSFLRSSFHCKYQIDVLTSGTVYLADVLYNESALFYFMEFVEQENVRHLVDFLLMADNFQKHLISQGSYDGMQAQNDAMIIYDKYFSLQATTSLGFSDSIRYEVEQNICQEEGPEPDCFLKPVIILTQYIEKTYLLQFLNSQLYFKYISECIITIQTGGADGTSQHVISGSESGSEHSLPLSAVNTLLAMDGKQPGAGASKVLKNIEDQDMRIDTGQFNPDALWQRPLAGKLLMSHIDKLGRVVTEFEPEPDKKKESRISKAVKKFVNREEENKNQEDMAWQIAEMIVSDICSLTMPCTSDDVPEDSSSYSFPNC